MKLVIDASSIKGGGGLTHLKELIRHAEPRNYGFEEVKIWAPDKTLVQLGDKPWLKKKSHPLLNGGYLYRFLWKRWVFKPSLDESTMVFIPGGGYISGVRKVVTMCQNLLPLELQQLNRYKYSWHWFRLKLLRLLHLRAYKKSDGVIFLNRYSLESLPNETRKKITNFSIVPHGLTKSFLKKRDSYQYSDTFTLLNVSSISLYRHQWRLVESVGKLRNEGFKSLELILVGPPTKYGMNKLNAALDKYPAHADEIKYVGSVPYQKLSRYYQNADAFIFSSTCETFGMTLLEAMGHSLPIACSDKSSMLEMLKDGGIYFDPENVDEIKRAIKNLMDDDELRRKLGTRAYRIAEGYSWDKTASKTFDYLQTVADR